MHSATRPAILHFTEMKTKIRQVRSQQDKCLGLDSSPDLSDSKAYVLPILQSPL